MQCTVRVRVRVSGIEKMIQRDGKEIDLVYEAKKTFVHEVTKTFVFVHEVTVKRTLLAQCRLQLLGRNSPSCYSSLSLPTPVVLENRLALLTSPYITTIVIFIN